MGCVSVEAVLVIVQKVLVFVERANGFKRVTDIAAGVIVCPE